MIERLSRRNLTAEELEGKIEALVKQGRVPLFQKVQVGSAGQMEPLVICLVPPEGTQFGDSYQSVDGDHGVLEFMSPSGEIRGLTDFYELSPHMASILESKVIAALNETAQI